MINKSTFLHLRIPFSFFLMPIYLFSLAASSDINISNTILSFIVLHLLIYPASNGYNSFFDKDESSIGILKNPPKVLMELYYTSLVMDLLGILLGFFISLEFSIMVLVYGLVSKAYSHPSTRLKKYPIIGWLAAGIFQGYFTFFMAYIAINDASIFSVFSDFSLQMPAILSSVILLGSYPMTQIYQHDEDARRGDLTISRKLGIIGTFHFTAIFFLIGNVGLIYYLLNYHSFYEVIILQSSFLPILFFFGRWYLRSRKDIQHVNYENTMNLNLLSSSVFNAFFAYLSIINL